MTVAQSAEVLRLRAMVRDLLALSTIPQAWVGREALAIAGGLADVLIDSLNLDFVFVRLRDPTEGDAIEVTRSNSAQPFPDWLSARIGEIGHLSRTEFLSNGGGEPDCGVAIPIGVRAEGGLVVAACRRTDFPSDTDALLLPVAANHGATAFQNACLRKQLYAKVVELGHAHDDLELKVAQRTLENTVLTEEQGALRRVATLVAQAVPASELFGAVALEVSTLFGAAFAGLARFEGESVLVVGESFAGIFPRAARLDDCGPSASAEVFRTGRSARVDAVDWSEVSGPLGDASSHLGVVSTVASPIVVEGRTWGALSISSTDEALPGDTEKRLEKFSDLVATAIANAEGRSELAASRRRIVAASDDARRRIERDLHDRVQQQLVSLGLGLGTMKADPPTGEALKEQLASVTEDVGSVLDALVETARGIHPAILSQGGLAAALRALARRSAVPVEVHAQIEGPLPDEVEVAAYYVAAEALTNAAKHARASVVRIDVTTDDATLTLMVRDDGVGGADPGGGSGLIGLQDRVEALGGTIAIDSSAGSGTCVVVTLPIATEPDHEIDSVLVPPQSL